MNYATLPGLRSTRAKKILESVAAYVADRPLAVSTAIALGSSVHAMVQHDSCDPRVISELRAAGFPKKRVTKFENRREPRAE